MLIGDKYNMMQFLGDDSGSLVLYKVISVNKVQAESSNSNST